MKHVVYSLNGCGGLPLFAQSWHPDVPPRGTVAIVHGMGEHGGRYERLAGFLNSLGMTVFAYDLRGHGRSGGPRVYVTHFDEYLGDTDIFLTHVRRRSGPLPLFLLGHSMGGTIAALYAATRQPALSGLVLSSPALRPGQDIPDWLIAVGRWVARALPRLPVHKIDVRLISRDPDVIAQARRDPLNHYGGTPARTGLQLIRAMERILAEPSALRVPLYIFHGTADRLTAPSGSERLYRDAASSDKTLRLYAGSYHETMNDLDRDAVLRELGEWLVAHLPPNTAAATPTPRRSA